MFSNMFNIFFWLIIEPVKIARSLCVRFFLDASLLGHQNFGCSNSWPGLEFSTAAERVGCGFVAQAGASQTLSPWFCPFGLFGFEVGIARKA